MFDRDISPLLLAAAKKMPVIGVIGPRQSGKTTVVKAVFDKHQYVSLENYQERELATADPKRFLQSYENDHGIILDEIQHVSKLLSYIQTYVDEEHKPGYIVLTGSQNILLNRRSPAKPCAKTGGYFTNSCRKDIIIYFIASINRRIKEK